VAPTTLDALPLPLLLRVLTQLPADAKLLAAAVCRSWRALLAERALWTRLDLSMASGVSVTRKASGVANPRSRSDALLRAAAARAGGQLESLCVTMHFHRPHAELQAVLTENAGTLRELVLRMDDPTVSDIPPTAATVKALLRAAPGLLVLEAGVYCAGEDMLRVLHKAPPFLAAAFESRRTEGAEPLAGGTG
jgi:hypothetical protein